MSTKNITREISRHAFEGGATAYSGAGAISPSAGIAAVTTTGADALTLANGTPGDLLLIYMAADGGNGTLTPTTKTGWTTFVFRDVGDSVLLQYVDNTVGWIMLTHSTGACVVSSGYAVEREVQDDHSTALTNTTDETTLSTKTISGANLKVGDVIHVVSQGILTATNGADTLTVKLKVGTELACTTGAPDAVDDDAWYIEGWFTVRVVGASGKIVGTGVMINDAQGTAVTTWVLDEATEDISGDFAVLITGEWSAASAANSCRSDIFLVEVLR